MNYYYEEVNTPPWLRRPFAKGRETINFVRPLRVHQKIGPLNCIHYHNLVCVCTYIYIYLFMCLFIYTICVYMTYVLSSLEPISQMCAGFANQFQVCSRGWYLDDFSHKLALCFPESEVSANVRRNALNYQTMCDASTMHQSFLCLFSSHSQGGNICLTTMTCFFVL